MLDFGCGEATHADRVAARVGQLWLCEAAERVRDHLRARFGQLANVKVIGSDELRDLAPGTFDLIVANSVAQYLTRDELDALLRTWRQLLKPRRTPDPRRRRSTRRQSDIGRTGAVALRMEQRLSRRSLRRPCPHRAVALSPHSRADSASPPTPSRRSPSASLRAGFNVERLPFNFEHQPARISFVATPR